jgi:hypothetical protein
MDAALDPVDFAAEMVLHESLRQSLFHIQGRYGNRHTGKKRSVISP